MWAGPLVLAVQDRSKEVRVLAEEVIGGVVREHGVGGLEGEVRALKPTIASGVKSVIRRISEEGRRSEWFKIRIVLCTPVS